MKRAALIISGGLLLGLLLYVGVYRLQTAHSRAMLCRGEPELAWLQHEFQLSDAQLTRVRALHQHYLSDCAAMCRRIADTNALIRNTLTSRTNVTPELDALINSAAALRAQCQRQMIAHFFKVSREMPEEQGQRYLNWVQGQIFMMPHERPATATPTPSAHGH